MLSLASLHSGPITYAHIRQPLNLSRRRWRPVAGWLVGVRSSPLTKRLQDWQQGLRAIHQHRSDLSTVKVPLHLDCRGQFALIMHAKRSRGSGIRVMAYRLQASSDI